MGNRDIYEMKRPEKITTKITLPEGTKTTEGERLALDWIADPYKVLGSVLDALMEDHKGFDFGNVNARVSQIYVDILNDKREKNFD
jgi:hypothetical protein